MSSSGAPKAIEATDGRRDLRSLPTFTIDPESARDFDDAISAERLPGGAPEIPRRRARRRVAPGQATRRRRVWVHIADVCAYVPEGSPVDREARRRSTSVYVPGAVEPMLPQALSNDACSLVPGKDRAAVTVELDLARRDGREGRLLPLGDPLGHAPRLRAGRPDLRRPRAGARAVGRSARGRAGGGGRRSATSGAGERGALTLDSAEPEFVFDREGHVRGFSCACRPSRTA